jgi:transposase
LCGVAHYYNKWQSSYVDVPWARPGSGFTLLFEALALALIERDSQSYEVEMPVNRIAESFPDAQITFDRFHVVKLLNEAKNRVRIIERKEHDELKGHKYTFLRNRENLSDTKEKSLDEMIKLYPTLGEAYRLKVLFNDLWAIPDKPAAEAFLRQWCAEVDTAKIPAFMKFANTVRAHWSEIMHFVESLITNGILEGINCKIQLAKRRARGYRIINNLINMIYFLCGKLIFDYPLYFT